MTQRRFLCKPVSFMRFNLIDRILEIERGKRIVAVKAVSLAEEYLADHFPTFPVLPGVFILQGLIEAATWLACEALGFPPAMILLKDAKNVTYKSFVKPGNLLRLAVTCRKLTADASEFDGLGFCGVDEMVRARFVLEHVTVSQNPQVAPAVSQDRLSRLKERFLLLCQNAESR